MSSHSEKGPIKPPQPPQIKRELRLAPLQWTALSFFALIPMLAAFGVIFEPGQARDTIWRVTFVYVFLMIAFRLTGKREVGQMSPLELVTLMMIPEIFSAALNKSDTSITLATVGVATLFLAVFLTGMLKFGSKKAEDVLEGKPSVLVHNGKYIEENMRHERITPDEIHAEMRIAGVKDLDDVKWAILENEGKISIIQADGSPNQRPEGTHTR